MVKLDLKDAALSMELQLLSPTLCEPHCFLLSRQICRRSAFAACVLERVEGVKTRLTGEAGTIAA